jgi:hypothetical protein
LFTGLAPNLDHLVAPRLHFSDRVAGLLGGRAVRLGGGGCLSEDHPSPSHRLANGIGLGLGLGEVLLNATATDQ